MNPISIVVNSPSVGIDEMIPPRRYLHQYYVLLYFPMAKFVSIADHVVYAL